MCVCVLHSKTFSGNKLKRLMGIIMSAMTYLKQKQRFISPRCNYETPNRNVYHVNKIVLMQCSCVSCECEVLKVCSVLGDTLCLLLFYFFVFRLLACCYLFAEVVVMVAETPKPKPISNVLVLVVKFLWAVDVNHKLNSMLYHWMRDVMGFVKSRVIIAFTEFKRISSNSCTNNSFRPQNQ